MKLRNKPYKELTSLIMPVWLKNKELYQYTKWCLDSLNETVDRLFELIIINNQADKKSNKFLKDLIQQFKKNKYCKEIKLISCKKNTGWTGGLEIGIKNSIGQYICFLNNDLIFERAWLSKMLNHVRDDVAAVGPTSNFVSGRQLIKFNKKGTYEEKVNYLIGFCLLITREALDAVKENDYYIDPRFHPGGSEELDLCIRLNKVGYDMVIAMDVFIYHFGSKSLVHINEFQKGERDFYSKRLQLLEEKYDRDTLDVLDEFQMCPKIAIGIPSIGETDAAFLAMYPWILQDAWSRFGANNVVPIVSPRNLPHLGRSEIVKRALMYGVEYLWFVDDDMICPPDIIWRLYSHQKDFVSALAYSRNKPYKPCIYKGKDKEDNWIPDVTLREELIEVDATGLSCALIKMSVIKDLIKKRMKIIKKRGGLFHFTKYGEDMNFTNELKQMGVNIWVDTDIVIKHLGQKIRVDDQVFLKHVQQQEEQKRGQLNT